MWRPSAVPRYATARPCTGTTFIEVTKVLVSSLCQYSSLWTNWVTCSRYLPSFPWWIPSCGSQSSEELCEDTTSTRERKLEVWKRKNENNTWWCHQRGHFLTPCEVYFKLTNLHEATNLEQTDKTADYHRNLIKHGTFWESSVRLGHFVNTDCSHKKLSLHNIMLYFFHIWPDGGRVKSQTS